MMGEAVKFQQFHPGAADPEETPVPAATPIREQPDADTTPPMDPARERLALLERLADSISAVAAEQAQSRRDLIAVTAKALGETAESVLPALARSGFAARVADLAAGIAGRGAWPNLMLTLAPADRADIEEALALHGAITGLKLAEDRRLAAGEAQLAWSAGGARIDVDAIATAALEDFRQRLDGLASKGD